MDLADIVRNDLDAVVGDSFTVSGEPPFDLVLLEASYLQSGPAGVDESRSFSVLFRGPADPALVQATYALDHAELGGLTLFLVPIAADDTGRTYEAVFNRLSG
ncbi:MAG: hypothetical protein M3092_08540 [Actinomycetia bacterium]|nr:hypothetical protein [Actinomycetes bacterium]